MSAYHLYGKTGYSGVNSNGAGHSGFAKKVIPSEVLLLSRFNRYFRKFPYHLSITCCQAPWATFPRRNERWRIRLMNLCRYRTFMAVTDVSFRHCYRYSCNTAVALQVRATYILIVFTFLFLVILLIRAFNSSGKHMASFCYFTDESGSTKPYSHKRSLYEHYRPPHGYLDQMLQLHPTYFQWRRIVQFHLSKNFLGKFHSNGKRSIANNREDSILETIFSLSSFQILCIFSILFPLILKTSGKCGDKTFPRTTLWHNKWAKSLLASM